MLAESLAVSAVRYRPEAVIHFDLPIPAVLKLCASSGPLRQRQEAFLFLRRALNARSR